MIKKIYHLFYFLRKLTNKFINFFVLKISNSNYKNFPLINGLIIIRGNGKLKFGKNVKINSNLLENPVGISLKSLFYITQGAEIIIGNNVGISNSLLYARENIEIEDDVLIGGGCQLLDNDFHSISYNERILNGDNNVQSKPILIKQGTFIGASCIILKGVTIGERSIIAAGSVVSKSIPNDEIWGGNPAKFIKKI